MTKQKLAKLLDVQTACLAHNAGWSVQVIHNQQHQPINVEELYLYNITGNYLINGGFKVTKEDEFYLHPKHNEELEPKHNDIDVWKLEEYEEELEIDLLLQVKCEDGLNSYTKSCSESGHDGGRYLRIYHDCEKFRTSYRYGCVYFPQFEWVEV